jgi:hypothetical protein
MGNCIQMGNCLSSAPTERPTLSPSLPPSSYPTTYPTTMPSNTPGIAAVAEGTLLEILIVTILVFVCIFVYFTTYRNGDESEEYTCLEVAKPNPSSLKFYKDAIATALAQMRSGTLYQLLKIMHAKFKLV